MNRQAHSHEARNRRQDLRHGPGLIRKAIESGASRAVLLPCSQIRVRKDLAALCRTCPNHGLALSCPPLVGGPDQFRLWRQDFSQSLFFCLDVDTGLLMSSQRQHLFRALHEITADLEAAAGKFGFSQTMGFAGGSCKSLFCGDHGDCSALAPRGKCRFPGRAKPSMSGFGIDVAVLIQTAEWQKQAFLESQELRDSGEVSSATSDTKSKNPDMSGIYGLILLK